MSRCVRRETLADSVDACKLTEAAVICAEGGLVVALRRVRWKNGEEICRRGAVPAADDGVHGITNLCGYELPRLATVVHDVRTFDIVRCQVSQVNEWYAVAEEAEAEEVAGKSQMGAAAEVETEEVFQLVWRSSPLTRGGNALVDIAEGSKVGTEPVANSHVVYGTELAYIEAAGVGAYGAGLEEVALELKEQLRCQLADAKPFAGVC